jgi:tetratricopeptide (TPR) repeat protein
MPTQPSNPPEVFVSYSHLDNGYKDDLVKQLNILQRQDVISNWHDGLLVAGEQWNKEIIEHLDSSRIILLLISPDFMNSDYIYNVELKRAAERHEAGTVSVIPVLIRNVNSWENEPFGDLKLGDFQALPTGAKFIIEWENRDKAFADVAKGIQIAVKHLNPLIISTALSSSIPRPPVVGFVARRDEQGRNIVERLKEELAPQGNQLVTLSGPGGVGKTTLAAEAARALKEVFGGRIVWSRAEGRADFTLSTLLDDITTQLGREGLRTLAPDLKEAQVRELAADPPTLIVLDNFETIAPDAKKGIGEWFALAQCSTLFTSRHGISSTRNVSIAAMSREEAQEYLEKLIAQTQDSQIFSIEVRQRIYETAEANPYVMQWVVAQIDAAQEPRAVLEELAQGTGDAAERVFDRSFNLEQLGDDGRAVLLALSLFAPSATREALAVVAGFGDDMKRVSEAVQNLRALWLIKGIDGNRRFTIEGLTRSLTRARLLKDARTDEFRQRFVAHFLSYARAHAQPIPEDFDALEAEKDNIIGSMDVAFEMKNWESVIYVAQILGHINGFLDLRGYWDEAINWNYRAVDAANFMGNKHDAAVYSQRIGIIQHRRGLYYEARQANEEALATYRELNSEENVASALHLLAIIAQSQGELMEARKLYNESLEINKRLSNQNDIAITLNNLATIARTQGELMEAQRLGNQSLEIKRTLDNQIGIAGTLHLLALIAQDQSELEESRRLYNESLEIAKRFGNQILIASILHNLAIIAQDQGDLREARRLYNESLEINKKLGNQSGIANTLHQLGRLAEREGDRAKAIRLLHEALDIYGKLKSPNAEKTRRILEKLEG